MKFVTEDRGREGDSRSKGQEPSGGEEVSLDRISVFLVPGLAFDREGRRLGRGGGHYDRVLSKAVGLKIGLAHNYQISNSALPEESHDIRMDLVVTNQFLLAPLKQTRFFKGVY